MNGTMRKGRPQSQPMDIETLRALERKILWLSTYLIHNANHIRANRDGLKVGGHQASSASLSTVMTALFLRILEPQDRVAVKPHASPVFHAIQYLLGGQSLEQIKAFRAYGGAQSYPSRTKDADDVDFSTGSVGLGVAITAFASLVQDYVHAHGWAGAWPRGRMVSLLGDAELDEGNIYECLMEAWKHDIRDCWWVIDYNRQSLDSVVSDALFQKHRAVFESFGWHVVTMKFGKAQEAVFAQPGGEHLREWIDTASNQLFAALSFQGGAAWRSQLQADLAGHPDTLTLVARFNDEELAELMTGLGGHCMETVVEAFENAPAGKPVCFIAYTIKGRGLPFQGHKDNHAGLMTPEQIAKLRDDMGIIEGQEWEPFAGLQRDRASLEDALAQVPFNQSRERRRPSQMVPVGKLPLPSMRGSMSTQEGFGKILGEIARSDSELARHIVTTSPDVTVSTNLGPWVNRRGIFAREAKGDVFQERKLMSAQRWEMGPAGQHIELGIAENNLFLALGALGLSHTLFGERLLPIGTLYDPFIARGLDALNYACYQDARFLLVATPSGITLAPEGGAHQSISTPLIGMGQDGIASFEPAFVDELAVIMEWAFDYMQRDGKAAPGDWFHDKKGGSVYLRLTTRSIDQPVRELSEQRRREIIDGGYWLREPAEGARLAVCYTGVVAPEAAFAMAEILRKVPDAGLFAVTSADRLNAGWQAAQGARRAGRSDAMSPVENLLRPLAPNARIVTVLDGHPATLSWLGGVYGHKTVSLGVEHFGQTGTIDDLYRHYGIDAESIVDAALRDVPARRAPQN